jgi:Polyketide cyclase / dehydrase and lipid transport
LEAEVARKSVSIEIERSPSDVFDFMIDHSKMSLWTDMQKMDLDGPLATGTTGSFDLPMMGRRLTFPFVITAYESGKRWAIKVTSKIGLSFDYKLEPTTVGTRVVEDIDVNPRGLLALLTPLLAYMISGEELGELRRLKSALEAPPAN